MAEKEKKSKLQEAREKLEKDYGKGTLISGSSKPDALEIVPTGSIGLDLAIGVGGLPYGRTVEIMGWESSGKSTITLNIIANHQKKKDGRKAVLIDGEHSFDAKYAKSLGVDVDELEISQPDYGEMAYDIANELIETDEIGVLVIDSQTSLLPKKVMQGEAEDKALGLHARLMSQEVPKLMAKASKHNCLLIFISQFREKIGVMFGSPITTNGGNALKFYAHIRLEVSKSIIKDAEGERTGNKTTVKVVKNKVASPYKIAEFDIDWGIGINRNKEILLLAIEHDIVKKSGSWYSYGESKLGQGENGVLKLFGDNPDFCKEIEDKLMAKISGNVVNRVISVDFPQTTTQTIINAVKTIEDESTNSLQCDQDT